MTDSRVCIICKETKSLIEFHKDKANHTGYGSRCKGCNVGQRMTRRKVLQDYLLELLHKNPCKDCGEKDVSVLEFDHIGDKKHEVAQILRNVLSLDILKEEVAKCEIICANCHRKRTYKRQGNVYKCQPQKP